MVNYFDITCYLANLNSTFNSNTLEATITLLSVFCQKCNQTKLFQESVNGMQV